ncbi:polypeptide N-acetylgalactosaminyltransferase 8-like [Culicoides brevitarsis]|uniref:polypeptide N-acetylgalactosaminyltransferase 8-like n=1 Tax=Culicoides brevitarsis TaxID=469753 RepID=UPI00307C0166
MPSFLEPSRGWLEPLLDPVIKDRRTITTPVVEYQHWTFDETATNEVLDGRGVFDLKMNILELPVNISIKNFENPIVTTKIIVGSAEFLKKASNKKAVTGLDGNFLELSLKTWLCLDGKIIKVPCSRFSHSFKEAGVHTSLANIGKSIKDKELKAIILKYFDEFAQKFFDIVPGRFGFLRDTPKSECTSFKHFLTNVAPDMSSVFFENPPQIISGTIFNANATDMCIDTSSQSIGAVLALKNCTENPKSSNYSVTKALDIRLPAKNLCWFASDTFKYQRIDVSLVTLQPCNTLDDHQKFEYDLKTKIIRKTGTNFCLDAIVKRKFVALAMCDERVLMQRWHFH